MGASKAIPSDGLAQCLRNPLANRWNPLPRSSRFFRAQRGATVLPSHVLHLQLYPRRFLFPEAALASYQVTAETSPSLSFRTTQSNQLIPEAFTSTLSFLL